jgi:hypothetical protein
MPLKLFYTFIKNYYYKPFVYRGLQFWTQGRNPHLLNSDFKGTVSGDGYFFEGLNILISAFCECADGLQGLSKASCSLPYTIINILFASLKLLTNFENAY